MNWKKMFVMLLGIFFIVGGTLCLFTPLSTYLSIGYVVGVIIFCDAIANIIAWFDARKYVAISGWYLFGAILSAIFGFAVMVKLNMQLAVDTAIIYMICAIIIVIAIIRIVLAVRIKQVNDALPDDYKNGRWILMILAAILMIGFSIYCMINPMGMMAFLGIIISIIIIYNGVTLITLSSYMPSKV